MISENMKDKLKDFVLTRRERPWVWAVVTSLDGEEKFSERTAEPCYGGLHNYDEYGYSKPGDLHYPFPKGFVLGLGVSWNTKDREEPSCQEFLSYLISPESPWRSVTQYIEPVYERDLLRGFILTETKVDPTPLVQMLLVSKLYRGNKPRFFSELIQKGVQKDDALLFALGLNAYTASIYSDSQDYYQHPKVDLGRWREGRPREISNGTFYEGFTYNRRYVAEIWLPDKESKDSKGFVVYRDLLGNETPKATFFESLSEKLKKFDPERYDS